MPRIEYVPKRFNADTMLVIDRVNAICRQYQAAGYDLTLRQVYYRFVANGWIANHQNEYKRLGKIINDARLAGLIDWDYIVDRTRNLRGLPHWETPLDILKETAEQFRHDKWKEQPTYIEVWVEKDALVGIVQQAAVTEDVNFFSCRGYTSQSEVWGAAQRIRKQLENGRKVVVLHLGDHDPSGIDMTRDIRERLNLFLSVDLHNSEGIGMFEARAWVQDNFTIKRIALNMDQVEQYNPPPNPAKITDSRFAGYVERFGIESWELDALEPDVLDTLIRSEIDSYRDQKVWKKALVREKRDRRFLKELVTHWKGVVKFLIDKRKETETDG